MITKVTSISIELIPMVDQTGKNFVQQEMMLIVFGCREDFQIGGSKL